MTDTNLLEEQPAAAAAANTKPEGVPEKFWDAATGTVRVEDLIKSYCELEKKLSSGFSMPEDDEGLAASIVRGNPPAWAPGRLIGERICNDDERGRVQLMRMAAESRARGWLRQRATWIRPSERAAWARAALGEEPWSPALVAERVMATRCRSTPP